MVRRQEMEFKPPTQECAVPNIVVRIPEGAFPGTARAQLLAAITGAATTAEQIPQDPWNELTCWVLLDEVPRGSWTCGGSDVTDELLPCMVVVRVPAGVLDDERRQRYARLVEDAFVAALPAAETRPLVTSVIIDDVPDGTWAVSGELWQLPQFAAAAGYGHLQQLVVAP
ncbi:MAG: tautomerase [Marmoricola sp.]|nr:tautomerase [Marmoricola sp.]